MIPGGIVSTLLKLADSGALGDPYWANVVSLMRMNSSGTNFNDDKAVSVFAVGTGSPTQSSTQSKFGGSSLYHPANSYIQTSNTPASVDITGADFTIEMWLYLTSWGSNGVALATNCDTLNGTGWAFTFNGTTSLLFRTIQAGSYVEQINSATFSEPSLNTWHHIAVTFVKSTNTYRFYVDGTSYGVASGTPTGTALNGGGKLAIGAWTQNLSFPSHNWDGYVDDFRITKGVARYTGATLTLPTTEFTTGTGTSPDSYSYVRSYLPFDGSTADTKGNTVSTFGATPPALSTVRYARGTGSMLFNNTSGSYMSVANDGRFNFTGDFTVEMYLYPTANGLINGMICGTYYWNGSQQGGWGIFYGNNSRLFVNIGATGIITASAATAIPLNVWSHVAVVRSGSAWTMYLNGVSIGTGTYAGTIAGANAGGGSMYIGNNAGSPNWNYIGYIDTVRVSNSALSTSAMMLNQ